MTIIQSSRPIVDKSTWTGAPVGDAAPPPAGREMNVLWSAEKLSDGTDTLDFALLVQDDETCLKPSVDGGFYYVCFGPRKISVHAKNGTFSCDFDRGECTGDDDEEKIVLEGEKAADADEETE
jgi:hypothetical protein